MYSLQTTFNKNLKLHLTELFRLVNELYAQLLYLNRVVTASKLNLTEYLTPLSSTITNLGITLQYLYSVQKSVKVPPAVPKTVVSKKVAPSKRLQIILPVAETSAFPEGVPEIAGTPSFSQGLLMPTPYQVRFEIAELTPDEYLFENIEGRKLRLENLVGGSISTLKADSYYSTPFRTILQLNHSAYLMSKKEAKKLSVVEKKITQEKLPQRTMPLATTPDTVAAAEPVRILGDTLRKQSAGKIFPEVQRIPSLAISTAVVSSAIGAAALARIQIADTISPLRFHTQSDVETPSARYPLQSDLLKVQRTVFEKVPPEGKTLGRPEIVKDELIPRPMSVPVSVVEPRSKPSSVQPDKYLATTPVSTITDERVSEPTRKISFVPEMQKMPAEPLTKDSVVPQPEMLERKPAPADVIEQPSTLPPPQPDTYLTTTFRNIQTINASVLATVHKTSFIPEMQKIITEFSTKESIVTDAGIPTGTTGVQHKLETEAKTPESKRTTSLTADFVQQDKISEPIRLKEYFRKEEPYIVPDSYRTALSTVGALAVLSSALRKSPLQDAVVKYKRSIVLPEPPTGKLRATLQPVEKKVEVVKTTPAELRTDFPKLPPYEIAGSPYKSVEVGLSPDKSHTTALTTTIPVTATETVRESLKPLAATYTEGVRKGRIIADTLGSSFVRTFTVLPSPSYSKTFIQPTADSWRERKYSEIVPDKLVGKPFETIVYSAQALEKGRAKILKDALPPTALQKQISSAMLSYSFTQKLKPDELPAAMMQKITAELAPKFAIFQIRKDDFRYKPFLTKELFFEKRLERLQAAEADAKYYQSLLARSISTLRDLKNKELLESRPPPETAVTPKPVDETDKLVSAKKLKKLISEALKELVETEAKQYGVL